MNYCGNCGTYNASGRFCQNCGQPLTGAMPIQTGSATPCGAPGTYQATSVEYAGFWRRLAAYIIDMLVIYGVVIVVVLLASIPLAASPASSAAGAAAVMIGLIAWVLMSFGPWLYFSLMESSRRQATLGKLALGIVVTGAKGQRISFLRATGRFWAKSISAMILLVGFIMAAFTERKQALHDMIAECLVVMKK